MIKEWVKRFEDVLGLQVNSSKPVPFRYSRAARMSPAAVRDTVTPFFHREHFRRKATRTAMYATIGLVLSVTIAMLNPDDPGDPCVCVQVNESARVCVVLGMRQYIVLCVCVCVCVSVVLAFGIARRA